MDSQKIILVPWDFTPLSDFALQHAIIIAKTTAYEICLLHVIEQKSDASDAKTKLDAIAATVAKENNIQTTVLIEFGKVFTVIPAIASKEEIGLVVMKTDGIKGMQKYIGSNAIKMMRGARAPFIVVQDKPLRDTFERVVYPIDFRIENKELLSYLLYLNKFYKMKLHLVKANNSDKMFKKNITNNLNYAKQLLESKHIEFQIISASGKDNFPNEIIEHAHGVNADLILIQLQRNLTLTKFLFGVNEQPIIANSYKIPVMCVNPKELLTYSGFR
jgi:nucleotide-binding universal stress UspA family protein